jgi:hypothetical protein
MLMDVDFSFADKVRFIKSYNPPVDLSLADKVRSR